MFQEPTHLEFPSPLFKVQEEPWDTQISFITCENANRVRQDSDIVTPVKKADNMYGNL